ncbi:hypothetical protein Pcaca05_08160 [Pectobacterium carotovorum subsp. carotovorum]|nr:hypothetical protein Pcaca05_08160 [Pectobacterium carotovorum subsp. carotovorum]
MSGNFLTVISVRRIDPLQTFSSLEPGEPQWRMDSLKETGSHCFPDERRGCPKLNRNFTFHRRACRLTIEP